MVELGPLGDDVCVGCGASVDRCGCLPDWMRRRIDWAEREINKMLPDGLTATNHFNVLRLPVVYEDEP
jgi:hypothetical protein